MYMLKRRGTKIDSCGRPFFWRRSLLGLLSPVVRVNLLFQTCSMITWNMCLSVRQKFQQLADEATVPDSIISSCQIDKHGTSLLLCLKRFLTVFQKQNDLVHGRLSVSRSNIFLWKHKVDYWFETIADQSFEDLIREAEQRDGTVAPWFLYRFLGLGDPDYQRPSPDFFNFELAQAG